MNSYVQHTLEDPKEVAALGSSEKLPTEYKELCVHGNGIELNGLRTPFDRKTKISVRFDENSKRVQKDLYCPDYNNVG